MTISEQDKNYIRGLIAQFTAERPLVVNVATYVMLEQIGLVPDERIIKRRYIHGEFITGVNGFYKDKG